MAAGAIVGLGIVIALAMVMMGSPESADGSEQVAATPPVAEATPPVENPPVEPAPGASPVAPPPAAAAASAAPAGTAAPAVGKAGAAGTVASPNGRTGGTGAVTNATPAAAAKTPPPTAALPATPTITVSRAEADARERLEIARAKINNRLLDPALADLRQLQVDFGGTTAAAEASYLSADILEKLGRHEEAMAAHVEFAKRFAGDARVPASRLRLAELATRARRARFSAPSCTTTRARHTRRPRCR
jgi:hypothetical protein